MRRISFGDIKVSGRTLHLVMCKGSFGVAAVEPELSKQDQKRPVRTPSKRSGKSRVFLPGQHTSVQLTGRPKSGLRA